MSEQPIRFRGSPQELDGLADDRFKALVRPLVGKEFEARRSLTVRNHEGQPVASIGPEERFTIVGVGPSIDLNRADRLSLVHTVQILSERFPATTQHGRYQVYNLLIADYFLQSDTFLQVGE
jgi:hypothetical protein